MINDVYVGNLALAHNEMYIVRNKVMYAFAGRFSDFAIAHLEFMTERERERETTDDGDEGEILWNCHVTVI